MSQVGQSIEGTCRLCGNVGRLCRSHIYPRFMYKRMKGSENFYVRYDGSRQAWDNARLQKEFVESLLCSTCEARFSKWENIIARAIGKGLFDGLTPVPPAKSVSLQTPGYAPTKLFLLSLLWRCHIASDREFKAVKLGNVHGERLRQMLLNEDPGEVWEYGCVITIPYLDLDDGRESRPAIAFSPDLVRFDSEIGLRLVQMYLDGVFLNFVVGSRDCMRRWKGSILFVQRDGSGRVAIESAENIALFRTQFRQILSAKPPDGRVN